MPVDVVAPGVLRACAGGTNCYVVRTDDGLLLVDAGLPAHWRLVGEAVRRLGAAPRDVRALVLTHGHFDHVGFAARAAGRLGLAPWVHEADAPLVASPYSYDHARPRSWYAVRHPRSLPLQVAMVAAGALAVEGLQRVRTFGAGGPLDEAPGRPVAVPTPGHTDGHTAFHLPERGLLFTGDALVSLDPYSARTGPRVVARAGTKDAARALDSLGALPPGRATVLPGHGRPWTGRVAEAVAAARGAGVA